MTGKAQLLLHPAFRAIATKVSERGMPGPWENPALREVSVPAQLQGIVATRRLYPYHNERDGDAPEG
jgi:hypothetical protein